MGVISIDAIIEHLRFVPTFKSQDYCHKVFLSIERGTSFFIELQVSVDGLWITCPVKGGPIQFPGFNGMLIFQGLSSFNLPEESSLA